LKKMKFRQEGDDNIAANFGWLYHEGFRVRPCRKTFHFFFSVWQNLQLFFLLLSSNSSHHYWLSQLHIAVFMLRDTLDQFAQLLNADK
uniref:Ovule protein n=1 Tax=Dracunculus medinensis TaxID=318479 RepID=A0A0N4ULI3_DRAME